MILALPCSSGVVTIFVISSILIQFGVGIARVAVVPWQKQLAILLGNSVTNRLKHGIQNVGQKT